MTADVKEKTLTDADLLPGDVKQPMKYLDRAMNALRDLGLMPASREQSPMIGLLNQISGLDETKVTLIARTLDQMSVFNDVVREQVEGMGIGERYADITHAFNSIRDDASNMVKQLDDGKVDTLERVSNIWQKVTRGDISSRFEKIKGTYLDVARDTLDQVERERRILEAYKDFRGALKESEVLAFEVLKKAEEQLKAARERMEAASREVENYAQGDPAEKARLELARDEKLRELQNEEQRYQIAKDLSVSEAEVVEMNRRLSGGDASLNATTMPLRDVI